MKKLSLLLSFFILLSAFTCDNEPLEGEFVTEETSSCNVSSQNVIDAALAFTQATDETYELLCMAYKTALQNQIQFCGDPDGSLQAIIDSLGDCLINTQIEDCASALEAVEIAELAFNEATIGNYTELCIIYREALLTYIELCGPDSEVQSILIELGNCIQEETAEGVFSVNAGTMPLVFDAIHVSENGDVLQVAAETGSPTYHIIYFEITLGETGVDIINDTFSININSVYYPSNQGFDDFTSTITTNTPGNIIGSFSGVVTNANGADLNLTSGVISVAY
ncbi:hypothetical protein [Psychroserpens ponticola]|uniref:Uncharacterized protein n=1 Tax=Psychroserpens ponticola TaxID=2932268 RepID=A0ABY7S0X2_9FLAO|nr:hypothetical protein [Psychroserpens ponticola]WCO03040.1 hypothetical protein MUN68_006000 [Psychroserpens ponticola]